MFKSLFVSAVASIAWSSVFGVTLEEVNSYAVQNAPQFKQQESLTFSQIETLKKIMATYDTVLVASSSRSTDYSSTTGRKYSMFANNLSAQKNIGLGVTLDADVTSNVTGGSTYSSAVNVGASIDLLKNILGRVDSNNVRASEYSIKKLNSALIKNKEALLKGIAHIYMDLLVIERELKEHQFILTNWLELERALVQKVKLGASEKRHLLQVRAKRIGAEIQIDALEDSFFSLAESLKTVVGGKEFINLEWPAVDTNLANGKSYNIELLEFERRNLELAYDNSKFNLFPNLKLNGSIGKESSLEATNHFNEMNNNVSAIGISFSFPLGNTEARKNKESAHYLLINNEYKLRQAKMDYESDLKKYKKQIESLEKRVTLYDQVKTIQAQRLDQEFVAYKQGRSQITDLISAHNDLINARLSYISIRSSLIKSYYAWLEVTGQLHLKY